jgi:cytochrome c oxidase subunit II
MDAAGSGAERIEGLWSLMLVLSIVVFGIVLALLGIAVLRSRRRARDDPEPGRGAMALIAAGGLALPAVVVSVLVVASHDVLAGIFPDEPEDPVRVEVTGHQFWWEVRYPDAGVVTANEIRIPARRPVEVRLDSADVIHSFWVPELQGKVDLVPGKVNRLFIDAAEPGTYRGRCAEFCGLQHALMGFEVVASDPEEFDRWLEERRVPPAPPTEAAARRGQAVFTEEGCDACHRIAGTEAQADVGPDLTHIASRGTVGAATRPNNRGNLAGWIVDPQGIKPGNRMPPSNLTGRQLQDLLDYLETLE